MPEPLSEPMFGAAMAVVEELDRRASALSLEELRILEMNVKNHVRRRQVEIAQTMRRRGCSWHDVGRGLGMSSQAAHQRFGPVCDR